MYFDFVSGKLACSVRARARGQWILQFSCAIAIPRGIIVGHIRKQATADGKLSGKWRMKKKEVEPCQPETEVGRDADACAPALVAAGEREESEKEGKKERKKKERKKKKKRERKKKVKEKIARRGKVLIRPRCALSSNPPLVPAS